MVDSQFQVVGHPTKSELLGLSGTSTLALSMLTAQAAAAVRRLDSGLPIDQFDERAIQALSDLLRRASAVLRTTPNALPSPDVYALLDVAFDTLEGTNPTSASPEVAADAIDGWADDLTKLVSGNLADVSVVQRRLLAILDVINSSFSSSGETPITV
jgi:hypothetical protein